MSFRFDENSIKIGLMVSKIVLNLPRAENIKNTRYLISTVIGCISQLVFPTIDLT